MMYLLDTDMFTLAHLGRAGVRERIDRERKSNEVVISLVTWIEVLRGRFDAILKAADGTALDRAQRLLRSSEAFLAEYRVIPFEVAARAEFDRFRSDKSARKVGRADLLIACIALAHDATLVTRNVKDFKPIPHLRVENWAD